MSQKQNEPQGNKPISWIKRRGVHLARDVFIFVGLFLAISHWQTRDMLDSDGSVTIQPRAMVSLEGDVHQLFQPNSQAKPTLVYFFAPWCTVCRYSIGNLNDLDPSSVNVVKVALDYTSKDSVVDFVISTDTQGPVLLGTNEVKQDFKVPGYPAYYLLNAEQQVVGSAMGYSTEWGMKLNAYLAK